MENDIKIIKLSELIKSFGTSMQFDRFFNMKEIPVSEDDFWISRFVKDSDSAILLELDISCIEARVDSCFIDIFSLNNLGELVRSDSSFEITNTNYIQKEQG